MMWLRIVIKCIIAYEGRGRGESSRPEAMDYADDTKISHAVHYDMARLQF